MLSISAKGVPFSMSTFHTSGLSGRWLWYFDGQTDGQKTKSLHLPHTIPKLKKPLKIAAFQPSTCDNSRGFGQVISPGYLVIQTQKCDNTGLWLS